MSLDGGLQTSQERETVRLGAARAAVLADTRLRAGAAAALGWLALYALATLACSAHPAARRFLGDVVYLLPVALASVLSLLVTRRATGRRRRLWALLTASNGLWLAGDLIWAAYAYVLDRQAPFPSLADGLYLTSYLLVPVAILVGFGGASTRLRARALLDAAVVGLGVGALGWHLLIAPQVSTELSAAMLTGVAYPLLGIVIVVTLVSVVFAGHRQVAPSVGLVAAAFSISALTDAGYTYLSLHDYLSGDWLNLGWQTEAVLLCLAGLCALRHDEGDGQVDVLGADLAMVPVLVGVVAGLCLAALVGVQHQVPTVVLVVGGLVVVGLVARFLLSVADTRQVALQLDAALREQQRLAVTDELTGLYNRRFFEEVLHLESDRSARSATPLALVVGDLDHFKRVNDTHGHQCGDTVLVEAAARLRRALRDSDVLARFGGEEFVMILPGADEATAREVAERCRTALCSETIRLHTGVRITVSGSFGLATQTLDTTYDHLGHGAASTLIRLADRALYAAKEAGRNRVAVAPREATTTPAEPALTPR